MIVQQKYYTLCKEMLILSMQLIAGGALGEVHHSSLYSLATVLAQLKLGGLPSAHNVWLQKGFVFLCGLPVGSR